MVIVVREGSEEEEATSVWDFQGNPSWTVPGTYRVFRERVDTILKSEVGLHLGSLCVSLRSVNFL